MSQFLDAQLNTINGAGDFNPGIHQGFATFIGNLMGQFIKTALHQLRGFFQNGDSFVRWQPACAVTVKTVGRGQPAVNGRPTHCGHFADCFQGKGVDDLQNVFAHIKHTFAASSSISTFLFSE